MTESMAAQRKVPVVQQDLPPAQTYEEICKGLLGLQHASSDVFERLHARIAAQSGKSTYSFQPHSSPDFPSRLIAAS